MSQLTHKPNSTVEGMTPEQSKEFLQQLIMRGLKQVEVTKKLVIAPNDPFPYTMNGAKATEYFTKLITYLINTGTTAMLAGFVEKLEMLELNTPEESRVFKMIEAMTTEHEAFLKDTAENCAILQAELGL